MSAGAWLRLLGLSLLAFTAAGNCMGPSGPIVPTSMSVDPVQLQLGVGDTGQVHVMLLTGTDAVDPSASKNGVIVDCYTGLMIWCSPGGTGVVTKIVGHTYTKTVMTIWIEGLAPGVETLWIHYAVRGPCIDPPLCMSSQLEDFLPPQTVLITIQ